MEDKIEQYLQMDEDSVYTILGEAAIKQQGLQGFATFKDKFDLGVNIFNQYKKQLKGVICNNRALRKAIKSEDLNTSLNIASLIIPIISNLVIPGTAVLVTALLVRYGIIKYCNLT